MREFLRKQPAPRGHLLQHGRQPAPGGINMLNLNGTRPTPPKVIVAERMALGVVIEFDDGKSAFYPSALLRSTFPQAIEILVTDDDDE